MKRGAIIALTLMLTGCAARREQAPDREPLQSLDLRPDCVNTLLIGLRWDGATTGGPLGRALYAVERDGRLLGMTRDSRFADTTVEAATRYRYTVTALHGGDRRVAIGELEIATGGMPAGAAAPYCSSDEIAGIDWDWNSAYTEPNGSDLWPVTWGRDGKVYAFFGDGGGIGGDNRRGRASFGIAQFGTRPPPEGDPGRNLYGGFGAAHPSEIDGKAGAIVAVGNDLYALGGFYNRAELVGRSGHRSGSPKRLQLAYSRKNAHTWKLAEWTFCSPETAAGTFCPTGFINFGRGNAGAPGGYVYLFGFANSASYWQSDDGPEVAAEARGSAQTINAGSSSEAAAEAEAPALTYLARVRPRGLLRKRDYRYFAGLDTRGNPVWERDARLMRPIFEDRNAPRAGCGSRCPMAEALEEAVYDPGVRRYIGTAQGAFVGQTSFYEAVEPWGPWYAITYNNIDPIDGSGGWANLGTAGGGALGVHIANAWTSPDGLDLWLTYSSDGRAPAGAAFPPEGTLLDSFNLVKARLVPQAAAMRPDVQSGPGTP